MKKLLVVLFLFCSIVWPSSARPHWKRVVVKAAVLTATSIEQYKATTYCSRGDVERCMEGYGERRAWNWIMIGGGVGAIFLSESELCGGGFWCNGISYAIPTAQVTFAVHDYTRYKPEGQIVHTSGNLVLPKWLK